MPGNKVPYTRSVHGSLDR